MSVVWSSDVGHEGDRVASMNPRELHEAFASTAMAGIRSGAPVELLDGLESYRVRDLRGLVRDTAGQRRLHLEEQIKALETTKSNARRNANGASDDALRDEFMQDAIEAQNRIRQFEAELTKLEQSRQLPPAPSRFTSECDFLAHGLAKLKYVETTETREFSEALERIVDIIDMDPYTTPKKVHIRFYLLLPADGRVARLGPLVCTVNNRAYAKTLAPDVRFAPESLLAASAREGLFGSTARTKTDKEVLSLVSQALVGKGYAPLAARLVTRSGMTSIACIAANDLWDESLPDEYDPDYVSWVRSILTS